MNIWVWTIHLNELLLQSNLGDLIGSYIQFMEDWLGSFSAALSSPVYLGNQAYRDGKTLNTLQ